MPPVCCFMIYPNGEVREEAATCCKGREHHRIVVESYLHRNDVRIIESAETVDWPDYCPLCNAGLQPGWITWGRRWKRVDGAERHDRPHLFGPGAMYDADWLPWKGPDGLSLSVVLPVGGIWAIDGHATDCPVMERDGSCCWQREGSPPCITVTPSIDAGSYHGHLNDGVLIEV